MKYNKVNGRTVGPNGKPIGRPTDEVKDKMFSLYMTETQFKKLEDYAWNNRMSKAGVIQKLIDSL